MQSGTLGGTQFVMVQCSSVRILPLDHYTCFKTWGWGVADPVVVVVILINCPQKKLSSKRPASVLVMSLECSPYYISIYQNR